MALKTIAPDGNNDMTILNGKFVYHSDILAYSDILKAAMLTQRSELQLDTDRGIPYFETAFYSTSRIESWANAVRRTTNSFPWVVRIIDFVYNFVVEDKVDGEIKNVNELRYTLKVLTDLGVATVRSDEP